MQEVRKKKSHGKTLPNSVGQDRDGLSDSYEVWTYYENAKLSSIDMYTVTGNVPALYSMSDTCYGAHLVMPPLDGVYKYQNRPIPSNTILFNVVFTYYGGSSGIKFDKIYLSTDNENFINVPSRIIYYSLDSVENTLSIAFRPSSADQWDEYDIQSADEWYILIEGYGDVMLKEFYLTLRMSTHPLDSDSDNDGITDGDETGYNLSPIDPDFDDDGIIDGYDRQPLLSHTSEDGSWNTMHPVGTDSFTINIDAWADYEDQASPPSDSELEETAFDLYKDKTESQMINHKVGDEEGWYEDEYYISKPGVKYIEVVFSSIYVLHYYDVGVWDATGWAEETPSGEKYASKAVYYKMCLERNTHHWYFTDVSVIVPGDEVFIKTGISCSMVIDKITYPNYTVDCISNVESSIETYTFWADGHEGNVKFDKYTYEANLSNEIKTEVSVCPLRFEPEKFESDGLHAGIDYNNIKYQSGSSGYTGNEKPRSIDDVLILANQNSESFYKAKFQAALDGRYAIKIKTNGIFTIEHYDDDYVEEYTAGGKFDIVIDDYTVMRSDSYPVNIIYSGGPDNSMVYLIYYYFQAGSHSIKIRPENGFQNKDVALDYLEISPPNNGTCFSQTMFNMYMASGYSQTISIQMSLPESDDLGLLTFSGLANVDTTLGLQVQMYEDTGASNLQDADYKGKLEFSNVFRGNQFISGGYQVDILIPDGDYFDGEGYHTFQITPVWITTDRGMTSIAPVASTDNLIIAAIYHEVTFEKPKKVIMRNNYIGTNADTLEFYIDLELAIDNAINDDSASGEQSITTGGKTFNVFVVNDYDFSNPDLALEASFNEVASTGYYGGVEVDAIVIIADSNLGHEEVESLTSLDDWNGQWVFDRNSGVDLQLIGKYSRFFISTSKAIVNYIQPKYWELCLRYTLQESVVQAAELNILKGGTVSFTALTETDVIQSASIELNRIPYTPSNVNPIISVYEHLESDQAVLISSSSSATKLQAVSRVENGVDIEASIIFEETPAIKKYGPSILKGLDVGTNLFVAGSQIGDVIKSNYDDATKTFQVSMIATRCTLEFTKVVIPFDQAITGSEFWKGLAKKGFSVGIAIRVTIGFIEWARYAQLAAASSNEIDKHYYESKAVVTLLTLSVELGLTASYIVGTVGWSAATAASVGPGAAAAGLSLAASWATIRLLDWATGNEVSRYAPTIIDQIWFLWQWKIQDKIPDSYAYYQKGLAYENWLPWKMSTTYLKYGHIQVWID